MRLRAYSRGTHVWCPSALQKKINQLILPQGTCTPLFIPVVNALLKSVAHLVQRSAGAKSGKRLSLYNRNGQRIGSMHLPLCLPAPECYRHFHVIQVMLPLGIITHATEQLKQLHTAAESHHTGGTMQAEKEPPHPPLEMVVGYNALWWGTRMARTLQQGGFLLLTHTNKQTQEIGYASFWNSGNYQGPP